MWWHGWKREDFQPLAGALMIGHIIECSTYATGGYYSGFKDLGVNDTDMGYPIAAIDHLGEAVVTMEKGKDGLVTPATVASQLLYEIQGPLYYNSDVTASIEDMHLKVVAENAVHVSGVKGLPPPPTTKGESENASCWWESLLTSISWHHCQRWLAGRISLLPHRPRYRRESGHD